MKDLFDELGDIFRPHFEKFEKMHDELKKSIQRGIIEDLMKDKRLEIVDKDSVWYPKEFVEWLEWDEETNHFYKDFTTNLWMCADDNLPERTIDEVYKFWLTNIKDDILMDNKTYE